MNEDYIIKIEGSQWQDGEAQNISLATRGSYTRRGDKSYIRYKETEATGFPGCITTVKAEGDQKVSMIRHGPAPAHLIIEKGRRNLCHYGTPEGDLLLGISAGEIDNRLSEEGGSLRFSYALDLNAEDLSSNIVTITLKEV